MASPADVIFVDGEVHTSSRPDRTAGVLAVRDGAVCRVADTYEVEFLGGIKTRHVDLDGRTVIPGFVDGYARLHRVGRRLQGVESEGAGVTPKSVEQAREYLTAAFDYALEQGITTVYEEVRHPETARAYHELALAEELPIRARLNYRGEPGSDESPAPLDAARTLGLVSGVGTEPLRIESVGIDASERPATTVRDLVERATETGLRVSATADDAAALEPLLSAIDGPDGNRMRIWLDGEVTEDHVQALADLGATVIGRPGPVTGSGDPETAENGGGQSQGPQFGRLVAAGIPVGFGSNGFQMNLLRDIERASSAGPERRLAMTEAVRAATWAPADSSETENRTGTLEVGSSADFVVLSGSPWEMPLSEVTVEMTVVDGKIVYEPESV